MVVSNPGARGVRWSIGLAAAWSLACGRSAPPPADPARPPLGEFTVDTATVTRPLAFPAQLYVEHDAVVAARAAGIVDSILVDIGSRVSRGQVLAQIESIDQEIAVARAEAAFDNAERALVRARGLSQVRGITPADSEHAELAHREATLTLRQARRDLELTVVTAPFAGVVAARYIGPERLVAPGDTLFRVTETAPLLARIRVPEAIAGAIRIGAGASVRGATAGEAPARVIRLAPAVDAASGTREVILELQRPGSLLPGASVSVALGSERAVVLVAPRDAFAGDGYVLVADSLRTALRAVVLGRDLGDGRVEVVSGLQAGERLARPGR